MAIGQLFVMTSKLLQNWLKWFIMRFSDEALFVGANTECDLVLLAGTWSRKECKNVLLSIDLLNDFTTNLMSATLLLLSNDWSLSLTCKTSKYKSSNCNNQILIEYYTNIFCHFFCPLFPTSLQMQHINDLKTLNVHDIKAFDRSSLLHLSTRRWQLSRRICLSRLIIPYPNDLYCLALFGFDEGGIASIRKTSCMR